MKQEYTTIFFLFCGIAAILLVILKTYHKLHKTKTIIVTEPKYRIVKTTKGTVVTYNPQIWLTPDMHWEPRYGRPNSYPHWAEITDISLYKRELADKAIIQDKELYKLDEKRNETKEEVVYEE